MAERFHLVENDNKIKLTVTCTDVDGIAINLAGCTINLRWRDVAGTVTNKSMTIEDAALGKASYVFLVGEIVPPALEYEVTVTKADGTVITSLDTEILGIRARLA